ncbi:plasmid replication initiation protein [Deinococcus sp. UYEF24]
MTCQAPTQYGVPHGLDNDVSAALIDLLMANGLPETGTIDVSLSELMNLAGFARNGQYRALIRESLDRLNTTTFKVSGGWRDHPNRRWITTTFHFIESLTYTHQAETGVFDERTMLEIRLADQLVASMRSGYTKPLNMTFMHSLSRPRTRILFRLLDAMRYDPENPSHTTDTLDVNLIEWADLCKIASGRPSDVRRALEGPHEELTRRGYLRAVTYSGRGQKQRVFYEFAPSFTVIAPALLARFRKHGVTDGVSRAIAQTYATSLLIARIEQFEELVRSGQLVPRKSPAAALVHLIKNPDQYEAKKTNGRPPAVSRVTSPAQPMLLPDPELSLDDLVASKSPEERGDYLISQLQLSVRGRITLLEKDQLRQRAVAGELNVAEVIREVRHHNAEKRIDDFLYLMRVSLRETGNHG